MASAKGGVEFSALAAKLHRRHDSKGGRGMIFSLRGIESIVQFWNPSGGERIMMMGLRSDMAIIFKGLSITGSSGHAGVNYFRSGYH